MKKILSSITSIFVALIFVFTTYGEITAYAASGISLKASHKSGAYLEGFILKLTTSDDTKLYYTTNGNKPTTSSKVFSEKGLKIKKSTTVRVLAKKSKTTKYYTFDYTITGKGNLYDIENKYYYSDLNELEQKVYKMVIKGIENHEPEVFVGDLYISNESFGKVLEAIYLECPEYMINVDSITHGGYSDRASRAIIRYRTESKSEDKKRNKETEKAAAELAAKVMNFSSDYEKAAYVAKWICYNTTYDEKDVSAYYCAHGPLVDKRGICKSYTSAFNYVMMVLGIPALDVRIELVKDEIFGGHTANVVCVDGDWCNIDLTFTGNAKGLTYNYFLVSDKTFNKTHEKYNLSLTKEIPKCTTDKYNKKVVENLGKGWNSAYSYAGTTTFEIDTKNVTNSAPFSLKLKNSDYNVAFIKRTYDVNPSTKYRFSAMAKCTGYKLIKGASMKGSGAAVGEVDTSNRSELYSSSAWKKLTYEFTTAKDQESIILGLYNGRFGCDCTGTVWYCDIKLEQYKNGKWVVVDNSVPITEGFAYKDFEESIMSISSLSFSKVKDAKYTGKAIKPSITVKNGSYTLKKGVDYTVSYSNNKKKGNGKIIIKGTGLYSGTKTIKFDIV